MKYVVTIWPWAVFVTHAGKKIKINSTLFAKTKAERARLEAEFGREHADRWYASVLESWVAQG